MEATKDIKTSRHRSLNRRDGISDMEAHFENGGTLLGFSVKIPLEMDCSLNQISVQTILDLKKPN